MAYNTRALSSPSAASQKKYTRQGQSLQYTIPPFLNSRFFSFVLLFIRPFARCHATLDAASSQSRHSLIELSRIQPSFSHHRRPSLITPPNSWFVHNDFETLPPNVSSPVSTWEQDRPPTSQFNLARPHPRSVPIMYAQHAGLAPQKPETFMLSRGPASPAA